ncbi:sorting nexin-11 isoform X1 [Rana temporaria]|uniref:sorting nexin-11 isoform X1 n=1 Tax=Rana temporaria TaxID=8407 RepID=UPI001AACE9B2|nr:sorting nexin-11 isoform X1 [Rana temporaria]XP_040187169.1 sorting nexin-11 isoform X1 [Rana temporaria]
MDDKEFITVRVQDPRLQNEGSWTSYVDYKIFLHTNSKAFTAKTSCVRRRYREFDWLRKQLQKYAGLVVLDLCMLKNIGAYGTMKKNGKNSHHLVRQHLQQGTSCFFRQEKLLAVKFTDWKDLNMLTVHLPREHSGCNVIWVSYTRKSHFCVTEYNSSHGQKFCE